MGLFDFIEKLLFDNPTIKLDCKYCGEFTRVHKLDEPFIFVCTGCKKKLVYNPKYPTSIWTLCKHCHKWTGHTKYQTRVECIICGDYLNPQSPE
jgi:ribosomal protein S27E